MIDIVDYQPSHLENIVLKKCHDGERPKEIRGNAITFLIAGEPLAIFGWYLISPGVAQVWGLLSEKTQNHKKSFHKAVKLFLPYSIQKLEIRRMQISVRCHFHQGWRWAKKLGFNCEGVMKQYGPDGIDCWLFSRIQT